mmetsp:Transcript_19959/g.61743  ORF Transcript_19959/g.61743 Transcript_19959/m.61743 type:complete len:204 (+) Transcript_19959:561-1172(+)
MRDARRRWTTATGPGRRRCTGRWRACRTTPLGSASARKRPTCWCRSFTPTSAPRRRTATPSFTGRAGPAASRPCASCSKEAPTRGQRTCAAVRRLIGPPPAATSPLSSYSTHCSETSRSENPTARATRPCPTRSRTTAQTPSASSWTPASSTLMPSATPTTSPTSSASPTTRRGRRVRRSSRRASRGPSGPCLLYSRPTSTIS